MEEGLVVNVHDASQDRYEWRLVSHTPPVFRLQDGTPVWEVWLWHHTLRRWFVMSNASNPQLVAQGVVYFRPHSAAAAVLQAASAPSPL